MLFPDTSAPLRVWIHRGSFDSAKECEQTKRDDTFKEAQKYVDKFGARERDAKNPHTAESAQAHAIFLTFSQGLCVASDDPRLK